MKGVVYELHPVGWVTCKWLRHLWKGCLRSRVNGLRLRELAPPELPGEQWVRCRTLLGGICGSDLAILLQRQPPDSLLQSFATFPCVLGHENVAVVEEVGSEVDPSWKHKRVTVDPGLGCRVRGIDPPCAACRRGEFGACENFAADGRGRHPLPPGSCLGYCGPLGGAWGEQFAAHESQLVEVPAEMSDRRALLTDPLACSLHAVLRADLSQAERVCVYGTGVLALGVIWALRATGWGGRIDAIGRHPHQAALAEAFGADEVLRLPGRRRERFERIAQRVSGRVTRARFGTCMLCGGYDVTFECVGIGASIEEAVKWTRSGGQTVLVSTGHGRGADLTPVWFAELTVRGCCGRAEEHYQGRRLHSYRLAHELMLSTAADLDRMLTHVFPLREYKAALAAAMDKAAHRSIKVALRFEGAEAGGP